MRMSNRMHRRHEVGRATGSPSPRYEVCGTSELVSGFVRRTSIEALQSSAHKPHHCSTHLHTTPKTQEPTSQLQISHTRIVKEQRPIN